MTKRIFDILPPELKLPEPEKKKEKESKKQHPFFKKVVLVIVLFFGLIVLINSQARSEITIRPVHNSLTMIEELRISHQVGDIDFKNKIIPAEFFEVEKKTWQEFVSTGDSPEGGKAEGIIRVYNSHNPPRSMALRATTRFLSSDGSKYFRSPERIYIPAAKIENKKIVPSFVDVKVKAIETGEDYNIGPSKFSLPGFVGSSYYYTIYGESNSPMVGGFEGQIKTVTEEDIENAKNILDDSLLKQAQDSLRESLTEDFVLLSSAVFDEEIESSCLQKVGTETAEFICQGKIKIKYLVFRKSFLKEISKEFILSEIPDAEELIEDLLSFEYLQDRVDLEKEEIILKFKILAETYKKINEETLKSEIKRKTQKDVENIIFNNFSGVEEIKIKFWPFWVKKTPNNLDRIKIKLDLGG